MEDSDEKSILPSTENQLKLRIEISGRRGRRGNETRLIEEGLYTIYRAGSKRERDQRIIKKCRERRGLGTSVLGNRQQVKRGEKVREREKRKVER